MAVCLSLFKHHPLYSNTPPLSKGVERRDTWDEEVFVCVNRSLLCLCVASRGTKTGRSYIMLGNAILVVVTQKLEVMFVLGRLLIS